MPQFLTLEKMAPRLMSSSLDEEWDDVRQAHIFLLTVGEACNLLALNQRLAVWRLGVPQHSRCMTHQGNWLTSGEEGLDQLDRILIFGEIPHWAVAARIENSIEAFLFDAVEANSLVKLSFCSGVFLEPARKVGLEFGLVTFGIERGTPAFGGGKCDFSPRVLENVVGSGELLKPESGLAPRVSELVVRSENHQDFHSLLLLPTMSPEGGNDEHRMPRSRWWGANVFHRRHQVWAHLANPPWRREVSGQMVGSELSDRRSADGTARISLASALQHR